MTDTNNAATTDNLPALLPPAQRAALALNSTKTEQDIAALVKSSADITAVLDDDGREQAHRIAMNLRTARTTIKNVAEEARDDANKFSRAVIAEEKRLIAMISPEETRVLALRDGYDAEQARIQAEKIAAERRRTEAHEAKLAAIARIPATMLGASAADVLTQIAALEQTLVGGEWEEFIDRAVAAYNDAIEQLQAIYRDKLAAEETAAAEAAAREADRQRIAAEQAEIARVRAEQAEAARQLADQVEAMRAQQEAMERAAREAEAERKRAADQAAAELRRQQEELAAARAEVEAERNRIAAAQRAAEELAADHAEALTINATWTPPAPVEQPPIATQEEAEARPALVKPVTAEETQDLAEWNAILDMADQPESQPPAEMLDLPEAEPTDDEILSVYLAAFGGDEAQARDRLARFGKVAA